MPLSSMANPCYSNVTPITIIIDIDCKKYCIPNVTRFLTYQNKLNHQRIDVNVETFLQCCMARSLI